MNNPRKKYRSFSILKQPAYRIYNYLLKDKQINVNVEDIRLVIENVKKFFRNNYRENISLIFVIDFENEVDDNYINRNDITKEIMSESAKEICVNYIDINCNLIKITKLRELEFNRDEEFDQDSLDYDDVSYFSEYINATVMYIEGINYEVYYSGKMLESDVIEGSRNIYGKISKDMLPISEYKKLIENHHQQCIKYANGSDHWKNKKERILRDSCEDIFKKSLWFYMDKFILDAVEVIPEYNLSSGNRIDIVVRSEKNNFYAFEVKVLGDLYRGVKDNGDAVKITSYAEDRVHHGLYQLIVYLNEDKNIYRGVLVVYDGRKQVEDIDISENEKHIKLDLPLYLYLESENATEKAKKLTKENKKVINR